MAERQRPIDFHRAEQLAILRNARLPDRSRSDGLEGVTAATLKAVLNAIDEFAREHGECYASAKTLADVTNLKSKKTIDRALAALYSLGLITKEKRWNERHRKTLNHVRIVWSELALLRPTEGTPGPSGQPTVGTPGPTEGTPGPDRWDTGVPQNGNGSAKESLPDRRAGTVPFWMLKIPEIATSISVKVEPLEDPKGLLVHGVYKPLKIKHLNPEVPLSLRSWFRMQLTNDRPALGDSRAELLLTLATAHYVWALNPEDVRKSKVALFVSIIARRDWQHVTEYLPAAATALEKLERFQRDGVQPTPIETESRC